MVEITIEDAWIQLASSVLHTAVKDVEKYHSESEVRKEEMEKPYDKRDYSKFVSELNYQSAVEFLKSSYADYLYDMVIWWNSLKNQMQNPKSINVRGWTNV